MMQGVKCSVVILTLLGASCTSVVQLNAEQKERVSLEVRQTLERYCNDVKNNGLMAEFRYLDSSDDFFWVPPGYSCVISFDSVARILRANAPHVSVDNQFESIRVIALWQGLATYTGVIKSATVINDSEMRSSRLVETGQRMEAITWADFCFKVELPEMFAMPKR